MMSRKLAFCLGCVILATLSVPACHAIKVLSDKDVDRITKQWEEVCRLEW